MLMMLLLNLTQIQVNPLYDLKYILVILLYLISFSFKNMV